MSLEKYGRLYRTLRHLKGQQLFYQVAYRLRRYAFWEKPIASTDLSLSSTWPDKLELQQPTGVEACLSQADWHFKFINLEHRFGEAIDWSAAPHGKLWNYNLHYFEWLWGLGLEDAKAVVDDWIQKHPFSKDAEGWEPYTLSLRLINWIGFWGSRGRELISVDLAFAQRLYESLSLQCDWLLKRLEKHILGNHYLENGVALWIAGVFFEGADATRWRNVGQQILDEQLEEQMLGDGMHFELSPMYHNRLLWILGWLSEIDSKQFVERHQRAIEAARFLKHPDGKIALFNDSAFGVYPVVQGEVPFGCFSMKDSGYYGMRTEAGDYLICDAGRIGPDYIPGHSHCDVGSFELSIGGRRLITDTGVYHYLNTKERSYSRSTAAHNVFAPVSHEQAEIWSAFRVGDRPNVTVCDWDDSAEHFHLSVSHDGFKRSGVSSIRTFDYDGHQTLKVVDRVTAKVKTKMIGRLHLAPNVEVVECDNDVAVLQLEGQSIRIELENVETLKVAESAYYPEFNVAISRSYLEYSVTRQTCDVSVIINWKR